MKVKNILVLTSLYPAPDLEKENTPIVHYFTREWVKMGYNVRVVHYPANFPWIVMKVASLFKKRISTKIGTVARTYQVHEAEYEHEGVLVKRIPLTKFKLHGKFTARGLDKAFAKTLDYCEDNSFRPDVIISHWVNPMLEMMARLKAVYNVPTCYVAHLKSRDMRDIYTPEEIQNVIAGIDIIGFRSDYIRQVFTRRFGYQGPSFQCYSGIPAAYVQGEMPERHFDDVRSFVFVGTLIERKYPSLIVSAVAKAYGTEDFAINYIGKGAEEAAVVAKAAQLGVTDKVHMLGFMDRDNVVENLKKNDVFVMVSRSETFGLVYLEAMAVGCITIASRKEGFDGIIEHGVNGFLSPAGDEEALAALIAEIRQMPAEKLEEISRNAMLTARKLTDRKVAEYYIQQVESVC